MRAFSIATVALVLGSLALTRAQAANYRKTVLNDGPTAYWRLNETGGSVADNEASASTVFDGTYNGLLPADYAQAGPNEGGGYLGFEAVNNAPRFTNGGVDLPAAVLPTGNQPRTYEFWFNADSVSPPVQTFFSHGINATGQRISVTASNSQFSLAVNGHDYGRNGLSLSGWNHGVITLPVGSTTSDDWLFYLNGSPLAGLSTLAGAATTINTGAGPGSIGYSIFTSSEYLGLADEFAIYGFELSAAQISAHYQASLTALVPIPEPSSCVLLGLGSVLLLQQRRKKNTRGQSVRK